MTTLRVGLFGLRGAGKTVALSTVYLAENCDGLEVTVRDIDTIRYLRPLAEALQRGDVPPPTMVADPTILKWCVRFGEASYELEMIDFAGELLDVIGQDGDPVTEQMMNQLRTQVRAWFISCDAVVLFIDSTDQGTVRYRDALIRLMDEMSQRPTVRGSHERAVVVVFTKADRVARTPEQLSSLEETKRILEGHPLYQIIHRRLEQHGNKIQLGVFLSSALGWQFISVHNPSQRKVKPHNLFAPLRWGLEQAAQIVQGTHTQVLEELNQELEERRNGPFSLVWALASSRSLNTMLEATDRDYQLTKGPCADKFAAHCRALQRSRSNQLRGVVAGCIGIVLVTLLALWYQLREKRIAVYDAYDRMVAGADSDAVVKERISYYRTNIATRWDSFWLLRGRRESADTQAMKDGEWEAISGLPTSNADQCKTKCLRLEDYLARPDALCRDDADALLRMTLNERDDRYEWEALLSLPSTNVDQCEKKCDRIHAYLSRKDAVCRSEAEQQLDATSKQWYAVIASLATTNVDQCEKKCDQYEAYLSRKDAVCRKEVRAWLDVVKEGTMYLDNTLGERKQGQDYWELSTGFALNLNPMFAFVEDMWRVRWRKSDPWKIPNKVIPPFGIGEATTTKILKKLTELNQKLPHVIP